jgi:predicted CopG family antitoxin
MMSSDDRVGVRVSPETWKRLNEQKQPGDSFDDVLVRLLGDGSAETDQ